MSILVDKKVDFDKKLALFYFGYRSFIKTADDLVEHYQLSKVHRRILFFVVRMPGLTVKELLDVLDITKQALNRPMQELVDKGWVETIQNSEDKRKKNVYVTASGKAIDDKISAAQIEKMQTIFAETGDPTGEVWTAIMEKYAVQIDKDFLKRMD